MAFAIEALPVAAGIRKVGFTRGHFCAQYADGSGA
eukprot:COSAG02_NODE_219_length_28538_cov_79.322058_14_plen_35_part_00